VWPTPSPYNQIASRSSGLSYDLTLVGTKFIIHFCYPFSWSLLLNIRFIAMVKFTDSNMNEAAELPVKPIRPSVQLITSLVPAMTS
jgi:hypothetical protein